jgi:hypothetical protein
VSKPDEGNRTAFLRKLLAIAEIIQAVDEAWARDRGGGRHAPRIGLKFIHAQFCDQYQTNAVFFIEPSGDGKVRNLAVYYENDRPAFRVVIPNDWSEDKVIRFLSSNRSDGPYPVWEIAARTAGNQLLVSPASESP